MKPEPEIRRVLVHRLGSLGDTVVALPCLHLIARVFPNAERRLLTNFPVHAKAPASAAVLDGTGLVHDYMRYSVGTRNPLGLMRLAARIRSFAPEVLVYLMHIRPANAVRRDRLFYRAAGVKRIVGLASGQEMKFLFDHVTGLYESESNRLARLIAELGDAEPANLANWDLHLSHEERQAAAQVLALLGGRPLIVCGPGTKMPAKDWGPGNWQALLGRLSAKYTGNALALVGAKEELTAAEDSARLWTGSRVNLCGRLTPRETAAVIERARVFLGHDSGPMHLAAAAGIPCVIAFAAAGPAGVWFPQGSMHQIGYHQTSCSGCYLERCNVAGHPCLTSITVEEMEAAVDRAMQGQPAPPGLVRIGA